MKCQEENIGENTCDLGLDKDFLAWCIKEKSDEVLLYIYELLLLMKGQVSDWLKNNTHTHIFC